MAYMAQPSFSWPLRLGAVSENGPRYVASTTRTLTSGRQTFTSIRLDANTVVHSIEFFASSATNSPTHQWFSLYDSSLNKLSVTVDDLTTPWPSSTAKKLNLSTPFTIVRTDTYYIGLCIVTSPGAMQSFNSSSMLNNLSPQLNGEDSTHSGLTTPATAPSIATLNAATGATMWVSIA